MLLLLFQAGNQTYAIDARNVIEVAPLPVCEPLAHAPVYVSGLAIWRARTIPVVNVSALIAGTAARALLSTRLIVVDYVAGNGFSHPLGLVAEKVVEAVAFDEARCEPPKVRLPDAPYLHGTVEHAGRMIQRLTLEELLPPAVRDLLFPESEGA